MLRLSAAAVGGAASVLVTQQVQLKLAAERAASEPPPATATAVHAPTATAERSFCKYGVPSDEHVTVRQGFASSISYRLRIPNWVAEHHSAADVDAEGVDRKHSRFAAECGTPRAQHTAPRAQHIVLPAQRTRCLLL
jgi:DNA/RNA endonuclease G (NUC1)